MRIGARRRLESFLDEGSGEEIAPGLEAEDPLRFRDDKKYRDRLAQAQRQSGEADALIAMRGTVLGIDLVAAAFEFPKATAPKRTQANNPPRACIV